MRCDEVISELSAPTEGRDRDAMAAHLAGCPACAAWARRVEDLDRLWEATRPADPSPGAWDAVWSGIASTLLAPAHPEEVSAVEMGPSRNGSGPRLVVHPAPAPEPVGARPRGRTWRFVLAAGVVGLAQAAAILVALGLAWRPHPQGTPQPADPIAAVPGPVRAEAPVTIDTEIPAGALVKLLETDGATARMVDVTPPEMNTGSDVGMLILNRMESNATPQVAAR